MPVLAHALHALERCAAQAEDGAVVARAVGLEERKCLDLLKRDERGVLQVDVDVDLQHPSLITLEEVEALSLLEPYGAGNNRPVFCLRGATLESVQGVGQNRHLKLKLQKSRVNFDGIFFSVTADECGVCAGMRVDAAFYPVSYTHLTLPTIA